MAPLTPTPNVPLPTILPSVSMTLGSVRPELLYPKEGSSTGEYNNYSIDPEVETFCHFGLLWINKQIWGLLLWLGDLLWRQVEIVWLLHRKSNKMQVWNTVSPLGIKSYYSQVLWLKWIENYHNPIQAGLLMAHGLQELRLGSTQQAKNQDQLRSLIRTKEYEIGSGKI